MLRDQERWQQASTQAMQPQEPAPAAGVRQPRMTRGVVDEHLHAIDSTK